MYISGPAPLVWLPQNPKTPSRIQDSISQCDPNLICFCYKQCKTYPQVEIYQSTVSMALPSKPISEHQSEFSYLLFDFTLLCMPRYPLLPRVHIYYIICRKGWCGGCSNCRRLLTNGLETLADTLCKQPLTNTKFCVWGCFWSRNYHWGGCVKCWKSNYC